MTLKEKVIFGAVVVVVTLLVSWGASKLIGNSDVPLGAVGNQLIEQYDPYVRYNGGVNSGLPIKTSSTVTAAGITSSGTVTVTTSNTATSTEIVGCVQMYATSTATAVHLEFSTTTVNATYTGGVAPSGAVAWRYGACPV